MDGNEAPRQRAAFRCAGRAIVWRQGFLLFWIVAFLIGHAVSAVAATAEATADDCPSLAKSRYDEPFPLSVCARSRLSLAKGLQGPARPPA